MKELMKFIDSSYTAFHAIENAKKILKKASFKELKEDEVWDIKVGESYYVVRNASSIIAFKIPNKLEHVGFNIVASHSDSPAFKLKPNSNLKDQRNDYTKLNVEPYGGMINSTWFDRPLGIAGRIFVEKSDNLVEEKIITLDETLVIPNVAIHLNRPNEAPINPQVDLLPLLGDSSKSIDDVLTKYVDNGKILSFDLFLYNKEQSTIYGANNEYLLSSRLDDLECVYTSLKALIDSTPQNISVCAIFNNEEVGSRSNNGAASTLLKDVVNRVATSLKLDIYQLLANSFIVSADNAHAVHPNHPEKSDSTNMVYMNRGIVIKHQAGLSYTTDALSEAVFKKVCSLVNVPYQDYTNRSDQRGGGTLGAISLGQISIPSVDIGLAQLAMHSSLETCGTKDIEYMIEALVKFYETVIFKENNTYKFK